VKRVELHQAQCMCCGAMHTAETPPLAMPNGSMSAALIAYIVSGKCGLHLPLKRIMEVLLEKGLRMAKSTMSNVMRHASTLLIPVYDRIVAALFTGDLLHLDGTGIKALTPGEKGSHRGQIAVYCNEQLTVYAYSENKEGRHLRDFLRVGEPNGFRGNLVADAANNMDRLYRDGTIQECGCWYHARDKFDAAAPGAPLAAAEAKAWIGTLFDVDSRAERAGDTAAERLARRKRESIPLLRGFYRWMNTTQHRYPPDEELWKAIQYCRNHWRALTRFMTNGSIPMTNNLAERELGVFGRGRKNWLFAGSDAGGEWLAILHTVVRTCQRLSVAPFDYLAWALPQLSDLPVNRGKGTLAALTPMAYAVAH
jgi:transposase